MPLFLSWAALVCGLAAIAADWRVRRRAFYLFKPLTTVLIGVLAWVSLAPDDYRTLIVLALALCLMGDVALMRSGAAAFVTGLSAFLLAHVLFIVAFFSRAPVQHLPHWWPLLNALALGLLIWLMRRAGRLAPAVLAYFAALLGMAYAATGFAPWPGLEGAPLVLTGALLFVVSDAVLAIRRFGRPFLLGQALTLSSYYAGLWCIVWGSAP